MDREDFDFWVECQVDSFVKTFKCYTEQCIELHGVNWWRE